MGGEAHGGPARADDWVCQECGSLNHTGQQRLEARHVNYEQDGGDGRNRKIKQGLREELLTCKGCKVSVFDQLKAVYDKGRDSPLAVFPMGISDVLGKRYHMIAGPSTCSSTAP